MAGDWIKLEHATVDKPEVYRIADLLGVTPDDAIGKLTRFWVWLDRNARDGVVTHVFAKSLEAIMHCPGFVAAMVDVGWLRIDDKTGFVVIPNYDRHNGNPAKSRALTRDRMQRSRDAARDADVTQDASPEKRRIRSISVCIPPDFSISDAVIEWAMHKGYSAAELEANLEAFKGRMEASGKKYLDWDKAFMNAVREDWYGIRGGGNGHRASRRESRISEQERVAKALTGSGPLRVIGGGG